jgi:hypothetical protein
MQVAALRAVCELGLGALHFMRPAGLFSVFRNIFYCSACSGMAAEKPLRKAATAGQALAQNDKKVNRAFGQGRVICSTLGRVKNPRQTMKLQSFVTVFIFVSKPGQVERDSRDAIE